MPLEGTPAQGRVVDQVDLIPENGLTSVVCFVSGTMIATPNGEQRIETLRAGDPVLTMDNGPQVIRWIGRTSERASGAMAPIRFLEGAMGNHKNLLVSPQHRMLLTGGAAITHFGSPEVLVDAKSLVDGFGATVAYGGIVTYFHMLFDAHEIVFANGAASESYDPSRFGLKRLTPKMQSEIYEVFPALKTSVQAYGPVSRACAPASLPLR